MTRRLRTIVLLLALPLWLASCRERPLGVATVELLSNSGDTVARRGDVLVLTFDDASQAKAAETSPFQLNSSGQPLPFEVLSRTGAELRVRLGDLNAPQPVTAELDQPSLVDVSVGALPGRVRVPLGLHPAHPKLTAVVWVPPASGTPAAGLVVDRGDVLRLVFDRPVRLAAEGAQRRVRVPEDVLLTGENDRLDNRRPPSRFAPGLTPDSVRIEVGSDPRFVVHDSYGSDADATGLAVAGTRIFPMAKITDASGRWGAVSGGAKDIHFSADVASPTTVEVTSAAGPTPRSRIGHTVTPLPGDRALIAGGQIGTVATGDVLVFRPSIEPGKASVRSVQQLPEPIFDHAATRLAGPDEVDGTLDDLVVITGGQDDDLEPRADLVAVSIRTEPNETSSAETDPDELETLELAVQRIHTLRIPRSGHAAIAVGPMALLLDGGRTRPGGLVGYAEYFRFEVAAGQLVVAEHTVFRSLPRVEHTLTLLSESPPSVLAFGGLGLHYRNPASNVQLAQTLGRVLEPDAELEDDAFLPESAATVLVSPVRLSLDNLSQSTILGYNFSYALPRRGHAAVLLPRNDGRPRLLIAGGTARHPGDRAQRRWEVPLTSLSSQPAPYDYETADAVLLGAFQPNQLTAQVVSYRAAELPSWTEQAHLAVPGLGVLFWGGEDPLTEAATAHGSIFLPLSTQPRRPARWLPLARPLTTPRTRARAFLSSRGGVPTAFLIGGQTDEGLVPLAEAVPLR